MAQEGILAHMNLVRTRFSWGKPTSACIPEVGCKCNQKINPKTEKMFSKEDSMPFRKSKAKRHKGEVCKVIRIKGHGKRLMCYKPKRK